MQISDFFNRIIYDKNIIVRSITDDEIFCKNKFGSADFVKRIPFKIIPEVAFTAGTIVGDGHLHDSKTGGKTIEISMIDREIISKIKENITKSFWTRTKIKTLSIKHKQRLYRINFSNSLIWSLFNQLFEIPSGKKSFIVKEHIFMKDNFELEAHFFTGLFLADGGMKHESISYITMNPKFFQDVVHFLKSIHVSFKTRIWKNKRKKNIYDILINKAGSKKMFLERLPLLELKFAGVA